MALYPFTRVEDISEEFGLSPEKVRRMAKVCRVKKNRDFRREINRLNGLKSAEKAAKSRMRREKRAIKLWNEGASMGEIAKKMRISRYTVYKYLLKTREKRSIKINRSITKV